MTDEMAAESTSVRDIVNSTTAQQCCADVADTVTLKSNSSCTCLSESAVANSEMADSECCSFSVAALQPTSSPVSVEEMLPCNSPLPADSTASSLCSPYDSPTHVRDSDGRPDNLYLSRSAIQRREKQWLAKKGSYSSLSECDSSHSGSMDALLDAATSTPLHAQGTVSIDGDMITFVADGINELIKRSRNDSVSVGRSTSTGSVSSSTSGWSASILSPGYSRHTRSPSVPSPDEVPPVDPRALEDLELSAHHIADSIDCMMQTLADRLYKMSTLTHSCLTVYQEAVDNTCDAVDASIKSMYALMAKCEELNKAVCPIYQLKQQICEIKRLLDLFEAQTAFD